MVVSEADPNAFELRSVDARPVLLTDFCVINILTHRGKPEWDEVPMTRKR